MTAADEGNTWTWTVKLISKNKGLQWGFISQTKILAMLFQIFCSRVYFQRLRNSSSSSHSLSTLTRNCEKHVCIFSFQKCCSLLETSCIVLQLWKSLAKSCAKIHRDQFAFEILSVHSDQNTVTSAFYVYLYKFARPQFNQTIRRCIVLLKVTCIDLQCFGILYMPPWVSCKN